LLAHVGPPSDGTNCSAITKKKRSHMRAPLAMVGSLRSAWSRVAVASYY